MCKCFRVCWSQTHPEKLKVTKRTAASLVLSMILVWSLPRNFPFPKKSYCWVIAADLKGPERQICDPTIDWTVVLSYIVNTQRYWKEKRKKGGCHTRKGRSGLEEPGGWVTLEDPCAKGTKVYSSRVIKSECLYRYYSHYFKVVKLYCMTVEILPQCGQRKVIYRHPGTSGYSTTAVHLHLPSYSK